jgi:hypothetical protein
MRSFDEPYRQFQQCAQFGFPHSHLAVVGLMIVACEMQQSVQDEYLQFGFGRVSESSSIGGRNFCRDRNIAGQLRDA